RHLIGLALHGGDRATDLLDHAIEAPLEEAELVGLTCRRAHGQIAPLRLPITLRAWRIRAISVAGMRLRAMATRMNTTVSSPAFIRLAPGSYSALCRKLEARYAIAAVSTRKLPTVWPWSKAYGRTAIKNAATKPPRPNHTMSTATSRTSNSDNAYTSHQRYQPRSWIKPRSSFTNAAPPATSTIVVGRVLTAPNPHPTSPSANPNATITRRSRWVREMVSRSLRRCSRPVASSFQPRTSEARDVRD